MNRRHAMICASALALMLATPAVFSASLGVEYSRKAYDQALASGKPFMLDFFADW